MPATARIAAGLTIAVNLYLCGQTSGMSLMGKLDLAGSGYLFSAHGPNLFEFVSNKYLVVIVCQIGMFATSFVRTYLQGRHLGQLFADLGALSFASVSLIQYWMLIGFKIQVLNTGYSYSTWISSTLVFDLITSALALFGFAIALVWLTESSPKAYER